MKTTGMPQSPAPAKAAPPPPTLGESGTLIWESPPPRWTEAIDLAVQEDEDGTYLVVNTDALNALSDEHREALLGSVDEAIAFYVDNYENNTVVKYEKAITEAGLTRVTFTPEQTAEFNELAESVRAQWVEENAGQFDSQALFDFTSALFNE